MANYNTYPTFGLDLKIKIIQDALNSYLGFTNVDFYGRVQKVISKDGKTIIPEVYTSNNERKEVYYDDVKAPGGNVFFVDNDEHKSKDGKIFVAKVKIVFMLNLNKILGEKQYRADTEIQDKCVKLIEKTKILEITSIEKGLDNILKEFNIENIKKNDMQPYHIFSVNGDLKYQFNCNT